jgi:hypothetical protein
MKGFSSWLLFLFWAGTQGLRRCLTGGDDSPQPPPQTFSHVPFHSQVQSARYRPLRGVFTLYSRPDVSSEPFHLFLSLSLSLSPTTSAHKRVDAQFPRPFYNNAARKLFHLSTDTHHPQVHDRVAAQNCPSWPPHQRMSRPMPISRSQPRFLRFLVDQAPSV